MSLRKSIAWSYGGQGASFLIGFIASAIVARLLTPFEFGVFALASAIMGFLSIVTTVGLTQYVVREKDLTQQVLRSAFTANLLLQLLLCCLLVIAGFTLAPQFGAGVPAVLLLLAANPLLSVVEFLPRALLQRDMQFGVVSALGPVNALVSALVTIPLAWLGWGALSIAVAVLVAHVVCVVMLVAQRPGSAILRPTRRGLRVVATFGVQMLSVSGATQAATRLSDMGLAKLQGADGLGHYARASQLFSQLYFMVYGLATGALFARMSRDFHRDGQIKDTYLRSVELLTAVLWPACIGMAILAQPFIRIVYGPNWESSALPLSLLMVSMFINLAFAMNWELFVLREETGRQARYELSRAFLGTILFVGLASISVTAAAGARVIEAAACYLLYRPHMPRMIGCEPHELRAIQQRSFTLTILATLPSMALMLTNGFDPGTGYPALGAAICSGLVLWAAGSCSAIPFWPSLALPCPTFAGLKALEFAGQRNAGRVPLHCKCVMTLPTPDADDRHPSRSLCFGICP